MNPKKADYIISGVNKSHYPKLDYPSFVFLGRSNVGKSSFINALCSRKNLAFTSSKPGKTVALNFYNIDDTFLFVDVPGYGYAQKKVTDRLKFGDMIEEYLTVSENLKVCFLVVDIRHNPTEDDCLMYNYLKHFGKKVVIVATKADKIGKTHIIKALKNVKEVLKVEDDDLCLAISSETKYGINEIDKIILSYK